MNDLLSLVTLEPWNRFTAGLIAAMTFARALDFLSTWIVTPTLKLEANPLARRAGLVRMALTILTKSFQEQRVTRQEAVAPCMVPAGGENPTGWGARRGTPPLHAIERGLGGEVSQTKTHTQAQTIPGLTELRE